MDNRDYELGYAKGLALALWEKHWKAESPNWQIAPDLMGVLTQIDNMTTGLARPTPAAEGG